MKGKKNHLVTKANSLVSASYRLGINEQRILGLAISRIQPGDEELERQVFHIGELVALIGGDNNRGYSQLRSATERLVGKVLHINTGKKKLLQVSWLSSAEYDDGDGTVSLRFSEDLKPYLLQLRERFTSYRLANIVQLRSRYSVRIYELLKQYNSRGVRSFELEELRVAIGLEEGKYPQWREFRRRILETAKAELKKKTDLSFEYKTVLTRQKVSGVKFTITSGTQQELFSN